MTKFLLGIYVLNHCRIILLHLF